MHTYNQGPCQVEAPHFASLRLLHNADTGICRQHGCNVYSVGAAILSFHSTNASITSPYPLARLSYLMGCQVLTTLAGCSCR
jgi:hypothetical protein